MTISLRTLPSAAATAGRGVFVGRAGELAGLEAAASEARCGQPKVVLVEGEEGIGKSSSAGAVRDGAGRRGGTAGQRR